MAIIPTGIVGVSLGDWIADFTFLVLSYWSRVFVSSIRLNCLVLECVEQINYTFYLFSLLRKKFVQPFHVSGTIFQKVTFLRRPDDT